MLVPFIYSTNDFNMEVPGHIWVFHKYACFASKNKFPIIATDIYFKNYENPLTEFICKNFLFKEASKTYLNKMQRYAINSKHIAKKIS